MAAEVQALGCETSDTQLRSSAREFLQLPIEPRHVEANFLYYEDLGDGRPPPETLAWDKSTYTHPSVIQAHTVVDVTGSEDEYTLERQGFQFCRVESKLKAIEFLDNHKVEREYYPEVRRVLLDITGGSKVIIFDHTLRRPNPELDINIRKPPVKRVHIDQSDHGAKNQVIRHLGDQAPHLLKSRYQIINFWRPIKPIFKDPLAICDSRSVPDSDIIPVRIVYSDRVGEACTVLSNTEHQWYYRYAMTTDMVWLIKCFDSKKDGRARRAPHSAFTDAKMENREARESIEVRALVFHEKDLN